MGVSVHVKNNKPHLISMKITKKLIAIYLAVLLFVGCLLSFVLPFLTYEIAVLEHPIPTVLTINGKSKNPPPTEPPGQPTNGGSRETDIYS